MQKLVRPFVHSYALRPVTMRWYGLKLDALKYFFLGPNVFLTLLGMPLAYVFEQK